MEPSPERDLSRVVRLVMVGVVVVASILVISAPRVIPLWEDWDAPAELRTAAEIRGRVFANSSDLNQFLQSRACRWKSATYDEGGGTLTTDQALGLVSTLVPGASEGSEPWLLVEAIPVRYTVGGRPDMWAIADEDGHVVGAIEEGQALWLCLRDQSP